MTTTSATTSSLGTFLEDAGCCQRAASKERQTASFQEHVEQAASETGAAEISDLGLSASPGTEYSGSTSGTVSEQGSQNGTEAMASQLSSAASIYAKADAAAEQAGEPAAEDGSITAVKEAMRAAGLDPDSVKMTYHAEDVWFPGGGWVNEMLLIETSNGRSLDFSARLSERSPEVTVCDVRHMLEGTGGWAALS